MKVREYIVMLGENIMLGRFGRPSSFTPITRLRKWGVSSKFVNTKRGEEDFKKLMNLRDKKKIKHIRIFG